MKIVLNTFAKAAVAGRLLALVMAVSTGANAQEIFRWVDKDGKVHYGDTLPPPALVKNLQTKKLSESVIEQQAVPYGVAIAMKNNPVTLYANNCGEACTTARGLPRPGRGENTSTWENSRGLVALTSAGPSFIIPWMCAVAKRRTAPESYLCRGPPSCHDCHR